MSTQAVHPAVQELLGFFDYGHLPEGLPREVAKRCGETAWELALRLTAQPTAHGAELTTGIRKLLEAKDCLVRAALPKHPDGT